MKDQHEPEPVDDTDRERLEDWMFEQDRRYSRAVDRHADRRAARRACRAARAR